MLIGEHLFSDEGLAQAVQRAVGGGALTPTSSLP